MEEQSKKINLKILVPIIIFATIILIVCLMIGINAKNKRDLEEKEKQEISQYNELINNTISLMYSSEMKMEQHCNMISSIWYDAIMQNATTKTSKYTQKTVGSYALRKKEFVDFNTAISNYLNDDVIIKDILEVTTSVETIKKNMTDLQKIPNNQYQGSYDKLVEMYGTYNTLYESIISPSGSYTEYSKKIKSNEEQFRSNYNQIIVMIPKTDN